MFRQIYLPTRKPFPFSGFYFSKQKSDDSLSQHQMFSVFIPGCVCVRNRPFHICLALFCLHMVIFILKRIFIQIFTLLVWVCSCIFVHIHTPPCRFVDIGYVPYFSHGKRILLTLILFCHPVLLMQHVYLIRFSAVLFVHGFFAQQFSLLPPILWCLWWWFNESTHFSYRISILHMLTF